MRSRFLSITRATRCIKHNAQSEAIIIYYRAELHSLYYPCSGNVGQAKCEVDKPLGQQGNILDRQPGFEQDMAHSAVVDKQSLDWVDRVDNPVEMKEHNTSTIIRVG